MAIAAHVPVTMIVVETYVARLTGKVTQVAWGADSAHQTLRWAASDANGHVLIGQL